MGVPTVRKDSMLGNSTPKSLDVKVRVTGSLLEPEITKATSVVEGIASRLRTGASVSTLIIP